MYLARVLRLTCPSRPIRSCSRGQIRFSSVFRSALTERPMPVPVRQKTLDSRRGRPCPLGSGLEVCCMSFRAIVPLMSSHAIQSRVAPLNPERVEVQNPDRAATADSRRLSFWLVDFALLAALLGTIFFFG